MSVTRQEDRPARERIFRRPSPGWKLLSLAILATYSGRSVLFAQAASLSGRVIDPSGGIVRDAEVRLTRSNIGTTLNAKTNSSGLYVFPFVQPGFYDLNVNAAGFKSFAQTNIMIETGQSATMEVRLEVGSPSQTVTVDGSENAIGTTNDSPAISLTVSREFVESMPLNGRSFQDLIQLAPGAVSANGYYSINGQRTSANNYTVDGVSGNLGGVNNSSNPQAVGAGLGGASPSQTVLGTTQSLVSIDSLQEFTVQTSGYAAEYGRNPGAQIQFTTRSGTNDFHGSLFEYFRNTALDASGWANNYYGQPKTPEHQNDFGGTFGGPVIVPKLYNGRNKTFFFFSYEGLRLILPQFESEYVPTQAFRNWAAPGVQTLLNAIPLPNPNSPANQDGCTIVDPATGQPAACDARFNYGYSSPNNLDNVSLRLDQNFGDRLHAFFRFANTPSSTASGAAQVSTSSTNIRTWTAGLTTILSSNLLNDFRFNYSRDSESNLVSLMPIGGATPYPRSLLIPSQYDGPFALSQVVLSLPNTPLSSVVRTGGGGSVQSQNQIVDSLAWIKGSHSLKFGVDWRRLTPTYEDATYWSDVILSSLAAVQQGSATVRITTDTPGKPVIDNFSLYAQDHWKITPHLTLDYGLRWELNPAPGPSNGVYPASLTSSDLTTAQLAPPGTPLFKTNYHSFAPRLGFAWNAISSGSHPLTIRGGFGVFFDTSQSAAVNAYTGYYPFAIQKTTLTNVPLPLSGEALAPVNTITPPYPYVAVSDPNLTSPYTEQWNISVDERLNSENTLSVAYVGNVGKKLLYTQSVDPVPQSAVFQAVWLTNNGAHSNYNALQIQDTGRIAKGLDLIGSFTWAHALDSASNDFSQYAPTYGNSDYDLRRVLNLALNYQSPTVGGRHWVQAMTRDWLLANRFSAQSGYPLNVIQSYVTLPNGQQAQYAPDLVPGVPIYLHGSAAAADGAPVPGNWRLNPAAFSAVPVDADGNPVRQGTLGRNFLRNPAFWTLNTSLQRSFSLHENLRLTFRAEAFNIFNHPNLSNPDATLENTTFGQLVNGSITAIGSSNPLYSMGAARSFQLSLHLQF